MLKYTIAAIEKTIDDIKLLARTFEFILAFMQIPFAVYNLATNTGIFLVNLALLIISSAYFIIFLIASRAYSTTLKKQEKKHWKNIKAKAKKIARWSKRPVQLYSFAIIIYGLTIPTTAFKPLSIILLLLQLLTFIIFFFIDLLSIAIEKRKNLFKEAWKSDMDDIKEPGRIVGNAVKSIFGKETTPKPTASRTEQILNKYIQDKKEKQLQAKAAIKQQKVQAKQQKKEARLAAKSQLNPQQTSEIAVNDSSKA